MKKNIQLLALIVVTCFTVSSCKKEKSEEITPSTTTGNGTIAIHIHTNVDTVEVEDYDSVNVMSDGRQITVSKAQLYISNIQLVKLDGSTVDVAGVIVLKTKDVEEYELGSVPAGNYKSVKFNVGLSATANAATPASGDSTLNQPSMWFGVTAQPKGFVFVNFQGTIDTTSAANGSTLVPFSYRIGTNSNLKTVTMPDENFTVSPNQIQFVHMTVDYAMLFDGIQLNDVGNLTMNSVSANATALGTKLANNIALMFSYEM